MAAPASRLYELRLPTLTDPRVREGVAIQDEDGVEIARGIVAFSAAEIEKIKGKKSNEIKKILNSSANSFAIVHRDSLVLLP